MVFQMLVGIMIFVLSAVAYVWPTRQEKAHAEATKVFGQEILCLPNTGFTVVPARQ